MTQRPGFFFYPGDYLRDTQCLSEPVQVAYDRIMCEHMRNICISQQRLNFFTKKLNADEIAELLTVLKTGDGGFQITWVAESISKYEAYRQSRSKNRASKKDKDIIDTSSTYVQHMESESEIEEEGEKKNTDRGVGKDLLIAPQMIQIFKGQPAKKFRVEVCLDATDASVRFWFESVELIEIIDADRKKIFNDQVAGYIDYAIIWK